MGSASNGLLRVESGPVAKPFENLTDDGDQKNFSATFTIWSLDGEFAPKVLPFGVISGGRGTPGASNDTVNVSAGKALMPGATVADGNGEVSWSASSGLSVTRPSTQTHKIVSITVTTAGAVTAVNGSEGTAFSTTRGGAGGPPFVPVDSTELFQVLLSSQTAAIILASELQHVPNSSREEAFSPGWTEDALNGKVTFQTALEAAHTGGVAKTVQLRANGVSFADHADAVDWSPPSETFSVNSQQIYRRSIASETSSVGAGSVTVFLQNGIRDSILQRRGKRTWIQFFPDADAGDHDICNGKVSFEKSYPADNEISATMNIAAREPASEVIA